MTCRGGRLLGLHRNGAVQQQLAQRPEGFLEVMDLAPLIRQLLLLLSLCGSMSLLLSERERASGRERRRGGGGKGR